MIDSMQVYREIPVITNRARTSGRPAELTGMVSVSERWTVARHRGAADAVIEELDSDIPFVLDAGTGMYLNAVLLDVPLAPEAPPEKRAEAERLAGLSGAENSRREARRLELELMGQAPRGSIWDGKPRYDTVFVYLRPDRETLDRNLLDRSRKIVRDGLEEARILLDLEASGEVRLNPSVREAIGVGEMLRLVSGATTPTEAVEEISTRTRRLARRQMRWFDKLSRSLPERMPVAVAEGPDDPVIKNLMHDKMWG